MNLTLYFSLTNPADIGEARCENEPYETKGGTSLLKDRPVGAALNRDIVHGEEVEAMLDAFISKREQARVASEGERAAEQSWKASVRKFNAAREAEERQMRLEWIKHQREVYRRRFQEKDALVEKLEGAN